MSEIVAKYDWFTPIKPEMEALVARECKEVLEIGSFEGLSTRWFLEWCPNARVTAIDHFAGGVDQNDLDTHGLFHRFAYNVNDSANRLRLLKMDSWEALRMLESEEFDVAFVDGSHMKADVLHDAVEAYRCVRRNGLIIFDDYSWRPEDPCRPQVAIDAFESCFSGKVIPTPKTRLAAYIKC